MVLLLIISLKWVVGPQRGRLILKTKRNCLKVNTLKKNKKQEVSPFNILGAFSLDL